MKALQKLDQWLLDGPFQTVVDLSGREPRWWVEQCAYLALSAGVIRGILTDGALDRVYGALIALVAGGMWLHARMGILAASSTWRVLGLLTWALWVFNSVVDPSRSNLATLLFCTSIGGSWYFESCKPPRPREPRRKLQTGGAA